MFTLSKGVGFQIGLVNSGKFTYRYGFTSQNGENFKLLQAITLPTSDFESLLAAQLTCITFEAKFSGNLESTKFEIGKSIGNSRRLIRVDGVKGIAFVEEHVYGETETV